MLSSECRKSTQKKRRDNEKKIEIAQKSDY